MYTPTTIVTVDLTRPRERGPGLRDGNYRVGHLLKGNFPATGAH